jgi:hypothetical protein
MHKMFAILFLGLLALADGVHAENIISFKQNVVRIYGADCRWQLDLAKKSLPKPPIRLLPQASGCDRPSIMVDGKQLWLAADEITTDMTSATCVRQARPAGQDAALAGDVGATAGAAAAGVPCTLR